MVTRSGGGDISSSSCGETPRRKSAKVAYAPPPEMSLTAMNMKSRSASSSTSSSLKKPLGKASAPAPGLTKPTGSGGLSFKSKTKAASAPAIAPVTKSMLKTVPPPTAFTALLADADARKKKAAAEAALKKFGLSNPGAAGLLQPRPKKKLKFESSSDED